MEGGNAAIVLFGRTGAGKSTLGNMLYAQYPHPEGGFLTGDSIRGVTLTTDRREGFGWRVFDTVGMGEAEGGSVGLGDAVRAVCKFFKELDNAYSHFILVARGGRMDGLDKATWRLFKDIFRGAEKNFVVVFTHTDETWVESNIAEIKECYGDCAKFIAVDFPPIDGCAEVEDVYRERRKESLERLERTLKAYNHSAVKPDISSMSHDELLEYAKYVIGHIVQFLKDTFAHFAGKPAHMVYRKVMGTLFR